MTIRVGIAGLGSIGQEHIKAVRGTRNVMLGGVMDTNKELARKIGSENDVQWCVSLSDLLNDDSIDAVCLALPDHLHFEAALEVIESGKGLLLEKPIATTSTEADRLVEAELSSTSIVVPGHTLRFDVSYCAAHRIIQSGDIGAPVYGYARRENPRSVGRRVDGRTTPMFFLGVHDVDALMWLLDQRVQEVQAMSYRDASFPGTVISTAGLLRFDGGAVVHIEAGFDVPDSAPSQIDAAMRITGETGELSFETHDFGMHLTSADGFRLPRPAVLSQGEIEEGPLFNEWRHFVDRLCGEAGARVTMREAADAVRVVAAIDEAAATKATVAVRYSGAST